MTRLPPILRYLADVDLDMGPFGLLGLTPQACDDQTIAAALQRQLSRVARHPHGSAIEADEVRLALHVAAAQLRDPDVRQELTEDLESVRVRRAPFGDSPAPPAPPVPPAPRSAAPARPEPPAPAANPPRMSPVLSTSFDHTAMWVIAHSGGWNAEAKRRLWSLANAMSVAPGELPEVIARVARRASGGNTLRTGGVGAARAQRGAAGRVGALPRAVPLPVQDSPMRKWGPLALIGLLTLSSLVMVRVITVIRTREIAARTIAIESLAVQNSTPTPVPVDASDSAVPDIASSTTASDPWPTTRTPHGAQPPEASTPPEATDAELLQASAPPAAMDPALAPWLEIATRTIASSSMRPTPEERLFKSARLALINCAAEQHAAGDAPAADETRRRAESLSPYASGVSTSVADLEAQIFRMTAPATSDDGRVAIQFQLARRQPGSPTDALDRLRFRQAPLGPADCDVIAEVAFYAPTLELRALARRFVDDQSANPFMVYGLLEAVSRAPRNQSSSEVIERITLRPLPRATVPDWPRAARAALIARLFEMLAPARSGSIDDLSHTLTEAYLQAAGASSAPTITDTDGASAQDSRDGVFPRADSLDGARAPDEPPDAQASERLFDVWVVRAAPFRASASGAAHFEEILRRRDARLALSKGLAQRFAAQQAAIVELAGFVIARDRPTRAAEVDALLERVRQERRQSHHVFEQIEANEVALARLWMIRFGAAPGAERRPS